jgi:hypothetical protein
LVGWLVSYSVTRVICQPVCQFLCDLTASGRKSLLLSCSFSSLLLFARYDHASLRAVCVLYSLIFIQKSNIGAGGRSGEERSDTSASQVLKSIYLLSISTRARREDRRARWLTRLPVALLSELHADEIAFRSTVHNHLYESVCVTLHVHYSSFLK